MKTSRKLLCMLLTLLMLVSLLPAAALANGAPVEYRIEIAPSTVTITVEGGTLTGGTEETISSKKYRVYTLSAEPGSTITYSGADGTVDLGSGTLKLDNAAATYRFARHNFYASYGKGMEDWTLTGFSDKTDAGNVIPYTLGEKFNDNGTAKQCALLLGSHKYGGTVTMNAALEETCYLGSFADFTVSAAVNAAQNKTLPINQYKIIKVTAPTAAATTFYKQDANYVVEPVTPDLGTPNEDGTTTYLFKDTAAHSNYQFRSMMPGQMTQAGYLADGNDVTVSFSGDPYSTGSAMEYDDNSVLLNVSDKNKLCMSVGETFKLRAFRGAWEIINTTSGNQMIEPDFHFSVLSGENVVSITPTDECSNSQYPNAKNGNATGNWMNVTALETGTAVVAVWYDAVNVYNANPPTQNDWSVFGATAPARYGVFVVSVGDDSSVTWNPASHDGDWDSEFDTVYYTGSSGSFTFKPTEEVTSVTVQNVYGKTLGDAQTVTAEEDGSYAVPVTTGANIIAVTTADGTDYQIVRAKKISYTITNNTTGESEVNGAPAISTEDSVTISFTKLDMPIPKMSGIYNPGYMGTAKTAYELNDSLLLTSAGTQYDFSTKNSITFIAHVAGENSLKGYISLSSMGDPFGNHRNITDDGRAVNTNAAEVFGDFGILPDITFTVTDNGAKASYEDATKIEKFSVVAGLNTSNMAFNWNKMQDTEAAWNKTTAQVSTFGLIANVTAKDYNNVITFRYWYEGEEVKSVQLQSGIATTIPNTEFALNPDKLLHLQVEIKPTDETLGDPITYNYLAFPGNSSNKLSYVHPFLKTLTAKSGDVTLDTLMLNTVDTAYTLCVGDAETIDLEGLQLVGLYNPANTGDCSDEVVLTKLNGGEPVGEPITVLEKGLANNPNRTWKKSGLDITGADALRIVVTSYVDPTFARTYTFTLDRIAGSENEEKAQAVDALIDAIGEVTPESEAAIKAAREAYDILTSEQKALVKKLSDLTAAEAALEELKNPPLPPIFDDGDDTITVTFRLIGSTKASSDVDLSKGVEGYNGAEYVTWVKTTTYTLEKGSTVSDLFAMALDDAGLDCVGLENNYISAITAPEACGGYVLAEMANGLNSGWMYTINGSHPGRGLNDRVLSNGNRVIWHYVDDYAYEVKDWPDGSSGDSSVWNKWLEAPDVAPGTASANDKQKEAGEADADIAGADIAHEATVKNGEATAAVDGKAVSDAITTAKADGAKEIVIAPVIKGSADKISVVLPKSGVTDIVTDSDAALSIQTDIGSIDIPNDTLNEIVKAAGSTDVAMSVETVKPAAVKSSLPTDADLGNAIAVEFSITSGGKAISAFGGKALEVSVPVNTKKFAEGKTYTVYVISADGKVETTTAKIVGGEAVIEMRHFSTVVITNQILTTAFADVEAGAYYYDAVQWAAGNGITKGTDDTHFSPDDPCDRAQTVAFLWRAAGCPEPKDTENPFTDLDETAYYYKAVLWAVENGITNGTSETTFSPENTVTRAQVVTFLYRYEKPTQGAVNNPFADVAVGTYYYDAVLWAAANGITAGTDAAHFSPDAPCTRGQIVTFLYRDFRSEPSESSGVEPTLAEAAAYVLKTTPSPRFGSVGGEWAVLGIARSGYAAPQSWYDGYYAALEEYVRACGGVLSTRKYTEYSRSIVALAAIGKDTRNVAGYDLTLPLGDYEKTIYQGTSGPVWALIALDSRDYPMPVCPDAATPATRQMYIDRLLETQNADGGWGIGATSASDVDMTAMALQALANYREQKSVAAATEKALAFLSGRQDANGGYASFGSASSESTAQVIVALCTLGIDLEDSRFVKNGHTILDDLDSYRVSGGGYAHVRGGEVNQMASEQALYALAAVQRAQTGLPGLYDMTK